MPDLLQEITALEVELHHPGTRLSAGRLQQLLHPDFHEVGRSGTRYDRDTVIAFLANQDELPDVVSDAFALTALSPDVVLLTYRSARSKASAPSSHHTLRSSVWCRVNTGWQLRYHQGTPAASPW